MSGENITQMNAGDNYVTSILMELQKNSLETTKTVSEMAGRLERLDERIDRSLATIPRMDALEDRVLILETTIKATQTENKGRMDRLWQSMQALAILVAFAALVCGAIYFAVDHFKMR